MVDPDHHPATLQPPPVILEEVWIDSERIDTKQQIVVPPGKQKFEFRYTGLSLLIPERVQFKYKLEGFDGDWVNAGTRRAAYYTHVPGGDYQFRVKACDASGNWNEQGESK